MYAVIADYSFAGLYKRLSDAERRRKDLIENYRITWRMPPAIFRVEQAEDLPEYLHQRIAFVTLRHWLDAGYTGKYD